MKRRTPVSTRTDTLFPCTTLFRSLPPMTRPDGTPVNAVFGFCSMIIKLLDDMRADHVAVVFDKGATSFRNDLYDAYKANRAEPHDELRPQFGLIRDATRAFALPCIEPEGFEDDDIIETYARLASSEERRVGTECIHSSRY